MKREKTVSVSVTLEEWKELRKKIRQAEDEEDKSYGFSSYVRSKLLLPHLNGDQAPTVTESIQENVSPEPEDTISETEQPLSFENVKFD